MNLKHNNMDNKLYKINISTKHINNHLVPMKACNEHSKSVLKQWPIKKGYGVYST